MNRTTTPDELSAMKGEFLASINHEIRTPLSGVIGMVDLLLETELTGEQKEYADDARMCAEHLLEILNSTLEFSALSAQQVVLEEADFSLWSMLDGLLDDFTFKAKVKGLRLTRSFAPNTPELAYGDALQLKQIIAQLISNAIKFTGQGEIKVKVSATRIETTGFDLNVDVSDTGIGISEDKIERIFDSFRQLETGLARRYTGLGLGLAVTKKLVQLMNGEIAVASRVGRGTDFSIRIPLGAPREALPGVRTESGPVHELRILVVEDDVVARTVATHILQRRPYQHVDCVSSGAAALQAAGKDRYQLILMDLQMPEMDGFETADRIRGLSGYSGTPIVAITANCSPEYRDLCLRHGMQGFLPKPVQASELLRTVQTFLPASTGLFPVPCNASKMAV